MKPKIIKVRKMVKPWTMYEVHWDSGRTATFTSSTLPKNANVFMNTHRYQVINNRGIVYNEYE